MRRKTLTALLLLPAALLAALIAAENGWLSRGHPTPQRVVRDLASGQPIAHASVVLTDSYWPPLGSLFASADPRRCRSISFVRSDAAGQLPPGTQGGVAFVLAPGVARLASYVEPVADGERFVLVSKRLQSSERSEPFGPDAGYGTQAEADAAREAFLASPEGHDYTAFTVQRSGEHVFRNFRMLQVRWIEVARSAERYLTKEAADEAWRATAWTLPGPADLAELSRALGWCYGARTHGLEHAAPLLDALAGVPDEAQTVQHWRQRAKP